MTLDRLSKGRGEIYKRRTSLGVRTGESNHCDFRQLVGIGLNHCIHEVLIRSTKNTDLGTK